MSVAIPDPILELLAAGAVGDLERSERTELERTLRERPELGAELEAMELAAAAAAVAELGSFARFEPLDTVLRDRILVAAPAPAAPPKPLRIPDHPATVRVEPSRFLATAGWLAAAACLVLAVLAWTGAPGTDSRAPITEQRTAFLETVGDAVRLEWADWSLNGAGPEIAGVKGDVVWSESEQRGYLRFVGLPKNDPTREQYQLWIVDRRGLADDTGQSARISGAIFDADTGETIVPIEPGIPVDDASLFAVTIEQPGGVWVSDMTRRVTVATKG